MERERSSFFLSFVVVVQSLSPLQLFCGPMDYSPQAPLSLRFPRQEYWSGLSYFPPGDLPHPGIDPVSPALAGGFFTTEPLGKPPKKKKKNVHNCSSRCSNDPPVQPKINRYIFLKWLREGEPRADEPAGLISWSSRDRPTLGPFRVQHLLTVRV